ncbi:DUF2752 domain-containing protein [Cellulomonas sp. ATA003]|uniref:DUF2752 domain-containing protein n=1 Tax=Cellulomonas sp. ATA003 TaxID=3073064 RepID=UPI002873D8DF|nr:DUF2752 domain-containing protein [Cellulomonas sp. ATA003]WNB86859.1 DUF2752 domain-containing protein [Cellulomonas sp. ATA003]
MTPRTQPGGPDLDAGPGCRRVRGAVAPSGPTAARMPLAVGGVALAAVVHLAITDPYRPGGHLVCPVLALTGLFCAGCGAQRAVHDLTHGDLAGAWGMNPLVVALAPVAVVAWALWLRRRWAGAVPAPAPAPAPRRAGGTVMAWALLVVVVGFAVLRNVPALAPWLAPDRMPTGARRRTGTGHVRTTDAWSGVTPVRLYDGPTRCRSSQAAESVREGSPEGRCGRR